MKKLTYDANGGSGAPSAQTAIAMKTVNLSTTVPTRTGYNFAGWSRSSTATSAEYSAGGAVTAEDMTLYAVWQEKWTAYGTLVTGLTESKYNELKQKMLKSVYQNGGFYVGRYETGTTSSRTSMSESLQTPVIKQNVYPYVKVTSAQAQELASQFASSGYTSSLMFGVQWRLILKYLMVKGVSNSDLADSTSWGNYQNSTYSISNSSGKYSTDYGVSWTSLASYNKTTSARIKLTTGASSIFAKQNIYDLAGNVIEYTLEIWNRSDDAQACARGGMYYYDGSYYSAAGLSAETPERDNGKHCVGFRVVLYKNN